MEECKCQGAVLWKVQDASFATFLVLFPEFLGTSKLVGFGNLSWYDTLCETFGYLCRLSNNVTLSFWLGRNEHLTLSVFMEKHMFEVQISLLPLACFGRWSYTNTHLIFSSPKFLFKMVNYSENINHILWNLFGSWTFLRMISNFLKFHSRINMS